MTQSNSNRAATANNALAAGIIVVGLYLVFRDPRANDRPRVIGELPADQQPTITPGQARTIAETVDQAIWSDSTFWSGWPVGSWTENEAVVIAAMTQPAIQTTGDLWLIMNEYGVRSVGLAPELTLFGTLEKYLDPEERELINAAWSQRRITERLS